MSGAAAFVAHLNGREPLGHDLRPVLVLQPRPVDALLEVPLAVEQPDPDHRQREVARRLEDVAGERAEPARVDRQRRVDAELGADEDDRAAEPFDRRLGARAVVLEHLLRAGRSARASGRARRRSPPACGVRSASCRTGFRAWSSQACGSSARKSSGPVRVPGPAVVERDPRERRELRRKPPRELGGALVRPPRAPGQGRDIHDPRARGRHGAEALRPSRALRRPRGSARSSRRRRRRAACAGRGRRHGRSRPPRAPAGTGAGRRTT